MAQEVRGLLQASRLLLHYLLPPMTRLPVQLSYKEIHWDQECQDTEGEVKGQEGSHL